MVRLSSVRPAAWVCHPPRWLVGLCAEYMQCARWDYCLLCAHCDHAAFLAGVPIEDINLGGGMVAGPGHPSDGSRRYVEDLNLRRGMT